MVANELLMQFQADVLGVPVVRPTVAETPSLGAAYAVGLAVGVWESLESLRRYWQEHRRWLPTWDEARRDAAYRGWRKAMQRAMREID